MPHSSFKFKNIFGGGGASGHSNNNSSRSNDIPDEPGLPQVYNESFFYGRITRQEAEDILKLNGLEEGLYLLRESITPMGNFSLSMVHDGSVVHYSIEKQIDGKYAISEGSSFPDPLSLIQHYQEKRNGFVTVPKVSCNRQPFQEAVAFRGVSYKELHQHMMAEAQKMRADMARAFGPLRESLLMHTLKKMHLCMPWFHGEISREEANKRLQKHGMKDGSFLIRARVDAKTFALSMCHGNMSRQYFIEVDGDEIYSLENGHRFKALVILVDHYHNKRDGLPCKLEVPVCKPNASVQDWSNYQELSKNLLERKGVKSSSMRVSRHRTPPPPPPEATPTSPTAASPPSDEVSSPPSDVTDKNQQKEQTLEEIYSNIRDIVRNSKLRPDQIILDAQKLGSGQFGEVKKGVCKIEHLEIPVAVKTLKNNNEQAVHEIQAEAEVMKPLDHPNIVRMIGVVNSESIMLVIELAPLGPLKKFLEPHKRAGTTMRTWHLLELMVQICKGMCYLESQGIVHRDLATRNVLLMTEHFAKISDFGLSRILDNQSEYYKAHAPGRWPLIWYAPECMYFHKFDSKSDVWSFGVTMWEIMSYGAKPYNRMAPNEILSFLERNERLSQPDNCDDRIYNIMLQCWIFKKETRPNFQDVLDQLMPLYEEFHGKET